MRQGTGLDIGIAIYAGRVARCETRALIQCSVCNGSPEWSAQGVPGDDSVEGGQRYGGWKQCSDSCNTRREIRVSEAHSLQTPGRRFEESKGKRIIGA